MSAGGIPHFGVEQRRARLGLRHGLAPGAQRDDPVAVAESVLALHATDPVTVHLSALARMRNGSVSQTEEALYEKRSLIRLLGMRRSMFVVPLDVAPIVQAACTQAIHVTQRKLLLKQLAESSSVDLGPDPSSWLAAVEDSTFDALVARGSATAAQLATDVPLLTTTIENSPGKPYGGRANITSRVMFLLGTDGRIVRGRPRGSWTSTQYSWWPLAAWIPGGLPTLDVDTARSLLIERWLRVFGPAPVSDIVWWTGLGVRDVRKALAVLDVSDVSLDSGPGVVLSSDLSPVTEVPPWAALLPGLDPTAMGWQQRDWYLGDYAKLVTDRSGNIGPTVWVSGRVVGVWTQRADGTIALRLLEDIGSDGRDLVDAAADRLTECVGDVRFVPKFPGPLDKELRA